jgi:hypothetical protein
MRLMPRLLAFVLVGGFWALAVGAYMPVWILRDWNPIIDDRKRCTFGELIQEYHRGNWRVDYFSNYIVAQGAFGAGMLPAIAAYLVGRRLRHHVFHDFRDESSSPEAESSENISQIEADR